MTQVLVRRRPDEPGTADTVFLAGRNLVPGYDDFEKVFGSVSSLEADLLLLAATVFAADRAIRRGDRELLARQIQLTLPVANPDVLVPQVSAIEDILRRLSNDAWRVTFKTYRTPERPEPESAEVPGRVLLFSGGLDSLAAAVEFGKGTAPLQLVSHVTHNTATRNTQKELAALLKKSRFNIHHDQFFVSSRDGEPGTMPHDSEASQRTRSFLFMTLAALTARRRGYRDILFLAENGQMAIHLPLTQGRVGAFSTHTAHPDVLVGMQAFLSAVLAYPLTITNPYVHRTKAEVVAVVRKGLPRAIPLTVSCWKNARLPKGIEHCGECVPCYVRRIALESGGRDPTKYAKDPWRKDVAVLAPSDAGRRNLVDLIEFIVRLERGSDDEIMHEWPELYSPHVKADETIAMYRRFAAEARRVLTKHAGVVELLA